MHAGRFSKSKTPNPSISTVIQNIYSWHATSSSWKMYAFCFVKFKVKMVDEMKICKWGKICVDCLCCRSLSHSEINLDLFQTRRFKYFNFQFKNNSFSLSLAVYNMYVYKHIFTLIFNMWIPKYYIELCVVLFRHCSFFLIFNSWKFPSFFWVLFLSFYFSHFILYFLLFFLCSTVIWGIVFCIKIFLHRLYRMGSRHARVMICKVIFKIKYDNCWKSMFYLFLIVFSLFWYCIESLG